jgi:single-stranded DNA-binding protein
MDGIIAKLTGTVIAPPEVRRTNGGMAWVRTSVVVDNTESGAETVVRVSMQGPTVPALAPQLAAGVRVFCSGRLTQRTWKTESGEWRAGLNLAARKAEIIERCPSVAA